ncbi:MAG: LptF/LptG family permease, partial [Bryobacteraceae bacterium]
MRVLSRMVVREVAASAVLGGVLFTFVLFLQKAGSLFSILVHNSAPPRTVAYLFALVLPQTLPFTVPLGVLVGVLIGLSRMSTDGEITALRAAGVPGRRVLPPILTFAVFGFLLTAGASLWLTPWATRETYRVLNHILAEQVTAEIEPRIFEEQFNSKILYVGDVIPGPVVRWRDIFIADITPPDQRPKRAEELADEPSVTVASSAIATPDVAHNRIQLSLTDEYKYEVHKNISDYTASNSRSGQQALDAQKQGEVHTRASRETDTGPLYREAYRSPGKDRATVIEDRIELNQRMALPPACILFALVGIPLGISSRKGGKSAAFVITAALAFL